MNRVNYCFEYGILSDDEIDTLEVGIGDIIVASPLMMSIDHGQIWLGNEYISLVNGHLYLKVAVQAEKLSVQTKDLAGQCLLLAVPNSLMSLSGNDIVDIRNDTLHMTLETTNKIELLLSQITNAQQDPPLCSIKLHALLLEVTSWVITSLKKDNRQDALAIHFDKVFQAKKLIEANINVSYTIPELAKRVGTNEQYLKKYFKSYVGKTIAQFAKDVKMDYAKDLLASGKYKITEIAKLVGYRHSTHFTTAFKKHFGFIPNSLRG